MTKNNLGLPLELKDSSFTLSDRITAPWRCA